MNKQLNNERSSGRTANVAGAEVGQITLGQDMHAATVVVEVQLGESMPQPVQKIPTERYLGWVRQLQAKYPRAVVHAVYEAGPCGYWLHRRLEEMGVKSYVAAPVALNGRRKCDKRDAGALRRQLHDYLQGDKSAFSVVRAPTVQQEQERALMRHRQQLVKTLQRISHQGRSLMLLWGLRVSGAWWGKRRWPEVREEAPEWMRELLADFQSQAQLVHQQVQGMDAKIAQLGRAQPAQPPRGIGVLTWLTLLREVGDWHRFNNRREVASYTGLCGSESSSGGRRREGGIDKRGNPRVRHALQEAVWRLLRWQPGYPPLQRIVEAKGSRGRRKAAVAAARRLAIDIWRLATGQTTAANLKLDAVL